MRKLTGMGVLLVALVTVAPHAGDGRIQIWEPTTITQSGHYVVTRDITTSGQSVILIQPPATRVTLDLNGFTLTTDSSMTVISAGNAINDAHTIRNGTIVGGFNGISSTADRLTIERVTIIGPANHGMLISGSGLSIITGCRVSKAVGIGILCNRCMYVCMYACMYVCIFLPDTVYI